MVKKLIILFFIVAPALAFGQQYDVLHSFDGRRSALYLTVAPDFDQYVFVYRRPAGSQEEYALLNKNNPLKQIDDVDALIAILGGEREALMKYLDSEDDNMLMRKINGNSLNASLTTLMFPRAAVAAGRMFIDSTVKAGAEYQYKFVYYDNQDKPAGEFLKTVKIVTVLPAPPMNLKSKVSGSLLTLEWEYPKWDDDRNNIAIKYYVYKKNEKGVFVKINANILLRNDASPGMFTELVKGEKKEAAYYITAADPLGVESKPSKTVTVKLISEDIPQAPGGLKATAFERKIVLVWDRATEPSVVGYHVFRKETAKADSIKLNKTLLKTERPYYSDSLIKSGVRYIYFVAAVGENGKLSKNSSLAAAELIDTVPPAPPAGLKHSFVNDLVKLEWKASRSTDVHHYNVYRGESREVLARIGKTTAVSFVDSGYAGKALAPGKRYYYAVSATDLVEIEGAQSDTMQIKNIDHEPPSAPTPVSAKLQPNKTVAIRVGMTMVSDLAKLNVYRRNLSGGKEELIAAARTLPYTFTDSTAKMLQSYEYSAEAIDSSGNKSAKAVSNTVMVKSMFVPAAVPRVTAVLQKMNGVKLTWVAVQEPDIAGYNVYRSTLPNGNFTRLNKDILKTTSYTDAGGETQYFYKVRPVNNSGTEGDWSEYTEVIVKEE